MEVWVTWRARLSGVVAVVAGNEVGEEVSGAAAGVYWCDVPGIGSSGTVAWCQSAGCVTGVT